MGTSDERNIASGVLAGRPLGRRDHARELRAPRARPGRSPPESSTCSPCCSCPVAGVCGSALLTALLSAPRSTSFISRPRVSSTSPNGENWVALAVFLVVAAVYQHARGVPRAPRASHAERDRAEADLTAEMARLLLSGESLEQSLHTVGQRIAQTFRPPLGRRRAELGWRRRAPARDSARRRRKPGRNGPGSRGHRSSQCSLTLEDRVVPRSRRCSRRRGAATSSRRRSIETKALRRANVVKTTLLRSVSHDLRSPLTAIATAAGGLESETISDEQRRELVIRHHRRDAPGSSASSAISSTSSRIQAGGVGAAYRLGVRRRARCRVAVASAGRAARHVRSRPRSRPALAARRRGAGRARRSRMSSRTSRVSSRATNP